MKPILRHKTAWNLRQSGKTYREIGEEFGVSSTRSQQLVASHQKRIDAISKNIFVRELQKMSSSYTTRILNGLRNRFGDVETIEPSLIVSMGYKELCKTRNIGLKSASHVALALENIGSIKDAKKWKTKR
ncbi:MAG: hypothetical protein PHO37_07495 [Kiritimatiellae bacterium]|nr:hypothetical protein [Kiritimatiellia bacterium]